MNEQYNEDMEQKHAYSDMMKLFETQSFAQRMKSIFTGINSPKDSYEYKFAKLQLQRLASPVLAFLIPMMMVLALLLMKDNVQVQVRTAPVEIVETTELEIEEEPPPPPEQMEFEPIDTDFDGPTSEFTPMEITSVPTDAPLSPKPAEANTVAIIKSPIQMRGVVGSRSPGQRGKALGQFGGSQAGEATVMRALRWLKSKQKTDGSWGGGGGSDTAMTGLAVLTYLAHGETPSPDCPEFGPTVEKAIKWLTQSVKEDGRFKSLDGNMYAQSIGAYALCEAYTMTRVPFVKDAAERALKIVVDGQQAGGGFDYKFKKDSTRNDLSFAGWASQAIKAGHIAGDLDVPGLEEAYKKCVSGLRANAVRGGDSGFGYTSPKDGKERWGLAGVGVLCMQLLGAGNESEVKNALRFLDDAKYSFENWKDQPYGGQSPIYYWYYITQAKFHAGGERWKKWNAMFSPELQRTQVVEKDAIADETGKMRDIGHWESPSEGESHFSKTGDINRKIMCTTLSALQLMVYYRYLPSFKTPEVVDQDVVKEDDDEIGLTIKGI